MSRSLVPAKNFKSFADLAAPYGEGVDYRITRMPRADSTVGNPDASRDSRLSNHKPVSVVLEW